MKKKKYWFKSKKYGWGWYPDSWQAWITLLIFIVIGIYFFRRIDANSHSASDTLIGFAPIAIVLIILLVWICYKKGEKPRWSWGN